MGRKRKCKNKGLPKGVYPVTKSDKFQAKVYKDKKLKHIGVFDDPDEAAYYLHIEQHGHHWVGLKDKGDYFGFTYLITNKKTGKKYIGAKQFYHWNGPTAGYKCTDPSNEWWEPEVWKDSGWATYTSSSIPLNKEIKEGNVWDFRFECLEMCRTKLELHLCEVLYMAEHDVLEAVDENGDYLWYNENIAGCEYRAPFRKVDVVKAREETQKKMREYYLKPRLDKDGKVIPFGELENKQVETRGFSDIRQEL